MLTFIFKSSSASNWGWIVLNALEKSKNRRRNVGTRFVQIRMYVMQNMQNSIFRSLPLLYANCKGSRKSATRLCNCDSTTPSHTPSWWQKSEPQGASHSSPSLSSSLYWNNTRGFPQSRDWALRQRLVKNDRKWSKGAQHNVFNRPGLILPVTRTATQQAQEQQQQEQFTRRQRIVF